MSKLILVDDEKATLSSVRKFINNYFPDIEICGCFYDGEDALNYLLEHHVDIVITDIRMPVMDGLELAKEIYERSLPCITIIISGFSEFSYAKSALTYNVFNYLLKPLDFKELHSCLENAVNLCCEKEATQTNIDLETESLEVLFTDLLLGLYSEEVLSKNFSKFNLNFADYNHAGMLIKISLDNYSDFSVTYDTDALSASLKNIIQLTSKVSPVYFVRSSNNNFYFIILSDTVNDRILSEICNAAMELLHFNIKISIIQNFNCLAELIPAHANGQSVISHSSGSQPIAHAIDYIKAHYAEALSRESVAEAVFLSPSHFSYLFKKTTGMTFMNYLTNVRMQKALELLNTNMKINEISAKIGYTGTNRFFVNFRHYTGYNPTEYRRRILHMETTNES